MTHQSFLLIFLVALFPAAIFGVPLDRFLPYGTTHGDTEMKRGDDTGSPALQLSVPFPFFDTLYSKLWVNVNGAISFAEQISKYTPVCGPVEREYSSIAPFWADVDITYTGHVFYRQLTVGQSLEKAQEEISKAFSNFAGIKLKWLLVATWVNVTHFKDASCCDRKRNTFQAIITTDGRHSFALFYYNNLTWTTGGASGGTDGLGGTAAQAGFDFGDGNNRMMIPGSCTGDVLKINDQSNVGDPGKWVFRVDRAAIQTAGCTQESGSVQLRISPTFVYTITRQPIELVGPCVENGGNGTSAFCRFFDPNGNTTEFEAKVHVNGSSYAKFTCPTPFFYTVGRLRVELHVSSGQPSKTQSYVGHFYTVDPHSDLHGNQLKVELETVTDAQDLEANKSAKILKFSWDPKIFPENQVQIQIGLLGLTSGKNQSWNELFPLVLTEENNGVARVDVDKVAEIQEKFNDTEVIQKFANMSQLAFYAAPAMPSSENGDRKRRFVDIIVPFLKRAYLKRARDSEIYSIYKGIINTVNTTAIVNKIFPIETRQRWCQEWYNKDPGTESLNLPDCPCTSEQADNDADFERDGMLAFPSFYHPGADHCIRSKRKSGAQGGQQCCYNKDGKLLVGPPGGGTEDMGYRGDRNFVSNFLSHLNTDVFTWFYCCENDPSGPYCKKYYEKRPSKDCRNYRPKRKAAVIGDPHMRTFDGLSYTFNGIGEFWLLINTTDQPLALQGRMEKTGSASVVTALAMKTLKSSLVQIQYSRVRVVDIFVDRIPMDLGQDETLSVEFNNVSVSVTKALDRVYVSFSDGHTFELSTGFGFGLSLSVPTDLEDKTEGLFGTLDDNFVNDLRARNGTSISPDDSLERIHYDFGLTWKIREQESLFDYFDKDYLYYNPEDKEFHPNFNFDPNESSAAAKELCGDNWACLYDFDSTGGDAEMANRTRRQVEAHETWRNVSNAAKVPPMCPPLNHPKNGLCVTSHLFDGAEAQCHCFPGFEFPKSNNGDEIKNKSVQTLRCQSSDAESADESDNVKSVSWNPEKVADCEPTEPEEECEGDSYDTERLYSTDIMVVPTQMSMTDEYGLDSNNTFQFYCAARGKNVKVFWVGDGYFNDHALGNVTEEGMTRSEIEQIFDKEFINSSKCISAKRLTIPFTNAESAGLYRCSAEKSYSRNYGSGLFIDYDNSNKEIRLKLERSGGMCHAGSEYLCADGRQCISINQACDRKARDCEDGSDEEYSHGCCDVQPKSLNISDIRVGPLQISITDEYGFHDGNNTVHFYCAARGKNTQVFFSRNGRKSKEHLLGNATEEDMTFSEIEQMFDESFINSSKCITAKRLTIPFTNAESAGTYSCHAENSYDHTSYTVRLKLERRTCHPESEWACADGRQCIAKSQLCDGRNHCEDYSDMIACLTPIIVDMKPDEVLLEIPESNSLNLTCRAVGEPVPFIKWRVNGTEMNCAAPDCKQVSEDGTGTLTLKNVKDIQSGIYTCVAFNGDGKETIPRKDWIVKVVGRKPKEIPQKNISKDLEAKMPPMCPPLNQPKNGFCLTSHLFEGAEAQCHCVPGFEFPESNNGNEIKNKSVQIFRCQSSDASESTDVSDNVKSVSWIPEKVPDCEPTEPEEECEEAKNLGIDDIQVVPYEISITDEYGFHGNNSVTVYCAARGKNIEVFFTRKYYKDSVRPDSERFLGNATEEDMTRSEIHDILQTFGGFYGRFVSTSRCITAKRLTIPFTSSETAGLYNCYAKNSYDYTSRSSTLKLERSGGVCHFETEFRCANGRQCVSKAQVCDGIYDCADHTDEGDLGCGPSQPLIVDMKPDEVNLDIPEEGSFTLTCRAIGRSGLAIKWRVNGTDLSCVAPDCQQVSENGTGILTLKNVKPEKMGAYTCEAIAGYKQTVPSRDWIVRVVDRVTYGKEISDKFLGYWKLDHSINFVAYLNARYHSQLAREKAEKDMRRKTILRTGTGSYSWVSKEGIYDNVVLGKEFPCTSSFCVDQSKWIVFVYLPTNETIIETHKMNSLSIYDYRYSLEDGFLVKFLGYWKLDHNINFPAYLNARYHTQPAREKAENDMRRKTILRTGTGSYSWLSKEGIYDNVVLGKEFPCTSSFCVDQSKWTQSMTYLSIFIILLCHAGTVFADCEYQSWPTPTETVKVVNPQRVKAGPGFDGKMKRYVATTGTLIEGELAIFELEDGATIQNVVLGKPVADGIHCLGSCTIKNCWWEEAGDDAATFMGGAGATYKVIGGGAKDVPNKVFQHDGGGTATIENFQVENVGKTWRSCGDCPNNSAKLPRKAIINCIKVTTPGLSIAGVNKNYGDSATLNNILIAGNVHDLYSVCQTYEGNTIEKPPPVEESFSPTQDGDGKYCIYKKSDITTS